MLAGGGKAFRYVKRLEHGIPAAGVVVRDAPELRPDKVAAAIAAHWDGVLGQPDVVKWPEVEARWRDALRTLHRPPVAVPAISGADLRAAVQGMWRGVSEGLTS